LTNIERLAMYESAEQAILEGGQEYEIAGRRFRRADLREIQAAILRLKRLIDEENTGSAGTNRAVVRWNKR